MNENNQPQSQQQPSESAPKHREPGFYKVKIGGQWHDIFYNGEQWSFTVMETSMTSPASESSPTEQPGDAKHTPGKKSIECTLSDAELIESVNTWISDLCQRRRTWTMSIPARPNEDVDLLIGEMSYRFKSLLSEVSTLRSKQAELVAENARLKAECSSHEKERYEIYSFDSSQAMEIKALQKELEQLRSELDKMREALEAMINPSEVLYNFGNSDHHKLPVYISMSDGILKAKSALSGGSKQ